MAIDDPTAIPETAEALQEYLQEADEAFERDNHDRAKPLYYAATTSALISDADHSRANHRLALIHLAAGEPEDAYRFVYKSREPGRDDILRALDGGTVDTPVDPSEIPQTFEETERYWKAAEAARANSDTATAEALYRAFAASPAVAPGQMAIAAVHVAEIAHADGRNDEAHEWADAALANAAEDEPRRRARVVLQAVGGPAPSDSETDASRALLAGLASWEAGDQALATNGFEAVLAAADATSAEQGRARFYLGSMAYHANDYDTARTHLQQAARDADDPEKTWATEMLEWRWQEEG